MQVSEIHLNESKNVTYSKFLSAVTSCFSSKISLTLVTEITSLIGCEAMITYINNLNEEGNIMVCKRKEQQSEWQVYNNNSNKKNNNNNSN